MFIDNGNDVIGHYEMASMDESDVAIFVANTGKPESQIDVAKTMSNFERNGIPPLATRSIVVLCRPYPWPFSDKNELPGLNPDVPVFMLPWDRHLRYVRYGHPLDYSKLRRKTQEALLDIALELCRLTPITVEQLTPDQDAEAWINQILAEMSPSNQSDPTTRSTS